MAEERLQKQCIQPPGHQMFSTCHTGQGLQIAVGDHVHIVHPTDPHLDFYIARVERLYEDGRGTRFLDARWYYRPEDLQHPPPSSPKKQEVYHTDDIDCMLIESITGKCKVIIKADFLKLHSSERTSDSSAEANDSTYFWEFTYSSKKGSFHLASRRDECQSESLSRFKLLGAPSTVRGTAAVAKELAEVLLAVERNIPKEILPIFWPDSRQAWMYKTANAKTIKEVAHSLLDLEEGVRILNDRRSQSAKDYAAWRKTVSGIHTYDLDVEEMMINSMCNKATRGVPDDNSLMKRKHIPEGKPKKLQKGGAMRTVSGQSSFRDDLSFTSGQTEARAVAVEVLPKALSSKCEILTGSMYRIDKELLPPQTPPSLKFIRAVLVAEKTRLHVTVKFPSLGSLQSYFGRGSEFVAKDSTTVISKSFVKHQVDKDTCMMGTHPQLDGHFIFTPTLAERILVRSVSGIEYLHQAHLWSFWVLEDLEGATCKLLSGDKGSAESAMADEHGLEDDAKGELGAAEALTQLIPANSAIDSPGGIRRENEGSGEYGSEGPLRCQIRWGMRSLRRASFGNRSINGTSPISISCDTGSKDVNTKDREKTLRRKSLDFPDQQLQQNVPRITHDFMQTERSSRMLTRREEKFTDLGATKSLGKNKLGNSKHIRSTNILKLPKDMKGRWASERYMSAQLKLIDIMHERGAAPGKPILRPILREEARKDIGDTGLLDHLLKHMTDTVVTNGERFRRRHNAAGAMEYWLEDASFMEIREAAGIEDPFWIPPPGWKPGDALPGRDGYGYFNRGMSPAEVAEMKKLKETVQKLKSELHSLSSRVRRSTTSREVTPETKEGLQETVTENYGVLQSRIEFEEEVREEVERIKLEVKGVREELHTVQDEQNVEEAQNPISFLRRYTGLESTKTHSGVQFQPTHKVMAGPANIARLEKIEIAVQKLSEEGSARWENLAAEKNQLQADLSEVQKSVALMQGDVRCIMKALGFSKDEEIKITSIQVGDGTQLLPIESRSIDTSQLAACDPPSTVAVGTCRHEVDTINCSVKASSVSNNIIQVGISTLDDSDRNRRKEGDTVISNATGTNRHFSLSRSASGHNRTIQNGFQVYKPPEGIVWPTSMDIPKPTGARDCRIVTDDVLSTRTLPPAANTSSCLGHITVASREDASARVIYDITGSHDKNQFGPSFQHHMKVFPQGADAAVDWRSQLTYSDHRRDRNSSRINWKTAERTHPQASGWHQLQPTYQSDLLKLAGVRREAAQARRHGDGLAILSVAAGCETNDKESPGNDKGQDMQVTLHSPISVIAKHCVGSSPVPSPAGMVYPEARKYKMLPVDIDHFSMRSIPSTGHTIDDSPLSHSSVSEVAAAHGQSDRIQSFKSSVSLPDRLLESARTNPMTESSSKAQHTLFNAVSKESPVVHVAQVPSTNLSLTSQPSPGSTCSSSKSASACDPEMSTTHPGHLIAAQEGRSYSHIFSGSPVLQKSADQLAIERLQQVAVHGLEQRQAPKNLLKGVRSTMQASFSWGDSEKRSIQNPGPDEKGSTWLGLAPPTSSDLHL